MAKISSKLMEKITRFPPPIPEGGTHKIYKKGEKTSPTFMEEDEKKKKRAKIIISEKFKRSDVVAPVRMR